MLTAGIATACLLMGLLVAAALVATGYGSSVGDAAETSLASEGFDRVDRDRDLEPSPCRVLAFVQPQDALSITGVDGRRQRVEVTVMEADDPAAVVAARLADGLTGCRTAAASPFRLTYADVEASGGDVDWTFTARGPVTSRGLARLRRVGFCTVYLSDQQAGAAPVTGERLDRVEAAVSAVLRSRARGTCTE